MVNLGLTQGVWRTWKESVLALQPSPAQRTVYSLWWPHEGALTRRLAVLAVITLCEPLHFLCEYLPARHQPPATLP